jgi:cyclohexa-1,5-dienecarbonyl-CoA hydratase
MAVRYETRDAVAYLTLDAPPLNILTCAMMDELSAAVEKAAADESLKAVALAANGKAFSAGADVGEHSPEEAPRLIASFTRLFRGLGALDVPLVIAVDGAALGAGFEVAMMADVLLASERAKLGQPEIRLAFFAPVGVALLPALVGMPKAVEINCSGRTYTAAEMKEIGLVRRVLPPEGLAAAVEEVLGDFRKASAAVMRLTRRTLRGLAGRPFEEARVLAERIFLERLMKLEDVREGIGAFQEKRPPVWKDR